jgi:hypothetical protein
VLQDAEKNDWFCAVEPIDEIHESIPPGMRAALENLTVFYALV